jgi:hypothetical protein
MQKIQKKLPIDVGMQGTFENKKVKIIECETFKGYINRRWYVKKEEEDQPIIYKSKGSDFTGNWDIWTLEIENQELIKIVHIDSEIFVLKYLPLEQAKQVIYSNDTEFFWNQLAEQTLSFQNNDQYLKNLDTLHKIFFKEKIKMGVQFIQKSTDENKIYDYERIAFCEMSKGNFSAQFWLTFKQEPIFEMFEVKKIQIDDLLAIFKNDPKVKNKHITLNNLKISSYISLFLMGISFTLMFVGCVKDKEVVFKFDSDIDIRNYTDTILKTSPVFYLPKGKYLLELNTQPIKNYEDSTSVIGNVFREVNAEITAEIYEAEQDLPPVAELYGDFWLASGIDEGERWTDAHTQETQYIYVQKPDSLFVEFTSISPKPSKHHLSFQVKKAGIIFENYLYIGLLFLAIWRVVELLIYNYKQQLT